MIKGLVGAVYEDDAAPLSDNIALLFDWILEAEHRKEYTYGPELHGMLNGWHVTAKAYWAVEQVPKGKAFVRLFIGKGKDRHCLAGHVEFPGLKETESIHEQTIKLNGIGGVKCETKQ